MQADPIEFSLNEWRWIHYSGAVISGASVLGGLSVLMSIRRIHSIPSIPVTLQFSFWLSFCQVIYNLCELIDHGLVLNGTEISTTTCSILGGLNVGFTIAAHIWSIMGSIYIYHILAYRQLWHCGKREWKLHLVSWGVALISTVAIYLCGLVGRTPIHCFLLDDDILIGNSFHIAAFYLNMMLYGSCWLCSETYSFLTDPLSATYEVNGKFLDSDLKPKAELGGILDSSVATQVYYLTTKTPKIMWTRMAFRLMLFTRYWLIQYFGIVALSVILPFTTTVFYILYSISSNIGGIISWILFRRVFSVMMKLNRHHLKPSYDS